MNTNNEDWSQLSDEELANHEAEAFIEDEEPEGEVDEQEEDLQEQESKEESEDEERESEEESDNESDEDDSEQEDGTDNTEASDEPIDYEAAYKKLTAPFKANGRDTKVDSVEEAIQLMQMGVGYHKNMRDMKEHKKVVKLLERNQLLDSDKLRYLIDLNNKNPQAIAKLMADGSIDPMDIDTEIANDYKPSQNNVSDEEIYFEEVVNSLKEDPAFNQVATLVLEQWDNDSRNVILQNPDLMRPLTAQMGSGVYSTIMEQVEKQRMLGNLQGVTDLEAYKQIGDQLAKAGRLETKPQGKIVTPKRKTNDNTTRRKAASPSSRTPSSATTPSEITELAKMDDEAFLKFLQNQ